MGAKKINNKVGIYKITNLISNKVYIGQSKEIRKRLKRHKRELNQRKHINEYLQRSWDKYGEENFKFEIIEECNEEQLDEREIYWISYYNSCNFEFGYNMDSGGGKGKKINKNIAIKRAKKRHYAKGEDLPHSKLTNNQVVEVKKLLYENVLLPVEIAKKFNVSSYVINRIKKGETYGNVITSYDDSIKAKNYNSYSKPQKLNREEVLEIKKILAESDLNQIEIAKIFNVNRGAIVSIKSLKTWKDIGEEYNEIIKNKNCINGNGNLNSKFRKEDIIEVKKLLATTNLTTKQIATKLNMSTGLVQDIKHFRAWKHIKTKYDEKIKELNNTDSKLLYYNLKEEDIINIKRLIIETDFTFKKIAEQFEVTQDFVINIKQLKYFSQIGQEYNDQLNIREEKLINDVIFIKKELANSNKTIYRISKEIKRSEPFIRNIGKLETYVDIAPEYNDLIKDKYIDKQKQTKSA